jgi:hypothetical protein
VHLASNPEVHFAAPGFEALLAQPVVLGHGGDMYSTQPIPTTDASSFNFTFDFEVGLELYRMKTRSVRLDYRYHHISDHFTRTVNPGIDNGPRGGTYSFGRQD